MLTIRLSQVGKKNRKMYRLIISEKSRDPYGTSLEILGSYNPHSKELQVKGDRVNYWISQGAGMSDTANNLLVEKNIIKGEKVKNSSISKKRLVKIEKDKEVKAKTKSDAEAKAKAAAEAAEVAAAEAKAAAEAPVVEEVTSEENPVEVA